MELLRILATEGNPFWPEGGFNLAMMYILFVIFIYLIGIVAIFWVISKAVDHVFKDFGTNDEETVDQNESIEVTTNNDE